MENTQYTSWVELFKIHCRAFQVIDHIIPPPPPKVIVVEKDKEAASSSTNASWQRLDAIVLQWIYGTISNDLLHTILKPDSTATQAWKTLANIFQDNKNSRALYLENMFSNTRLNEYPNVSAYCQALKVLADQLTNVNTPVSNQRLVLQLIADLNEQFDGVSIRLQQTSPLPDFTIARSKLILKETRKAHQTNPTGTALHANTTNLSPNTTPAASQQPPTAASLAANHSTSHPYEHSGRGYSKTCPNRAGYTPRGRSRDKRGRGRCRSRGRGYYSSYGAWPVPHQPSYPPPHAC